ncbi:methyltransferase domain-containing protein [Palleronia rufa]|uniref:methyltransferase domain-containing protein n=1 Tax=Palleronia rufa TaxID=1530186 RepID=UPI00055D8C5B|nr:methyltransferase domain-containing protein [Palleronia rufa]
MSQAPPTLTDRIALARNRARTRNDALFLHDAAADRFDETISAVNRTFTCPAVVTGHPAFWAARHPGAQIVADDAALALEPGAHDLILHAMALHWADDPVGQLVQARRALKPDGLFLAACFGGRTLSELRQALAEAETATRGGISPRIAPMMEVRDGGALLQRAGFALPVADTDRFTVTYADVSALMRDLRHMGEGNALASRDARPIPRSMLDAARNAYSAPDPGDPARIATTFELMHLSGWAPAESQPKPLRPGSAAARLADALGGAEHPLRDDSHERGD